MNGLGETPEPLDARSRVQLDDHPLVRERVPEARVVRDADRAFAARHEVASHPRRRVVVAAQPERFAQGRGRARPLDARDVERGMPSERADLGIGAQGALDRHALRRQPGEQRAVEPARRGRPPSRRRAGPDRSSRARSPRPATRRRLEARSRPTTARGPAIDESGRAAAGHRPAAGARRGEPRPRERREPDDACPIHGRHHGGRTSHASSPAQNAAAAAGSAQAFIPWRTAGSLERRRADAASRRSGRRPTRTARSAVR